MTKPDNAPSTAQSAQADGDTFVVSAAFASIRFFRAFTPYALVSRLVLGQKTPSYFFVDVWVLAHLAIAIGSWVVVSGATGVLLWLLIGYGAVRVTELTIYNIDVMLGNPDTEEPYRLRSLRRSLILALANYAEVLFWFAAFYRSSPASFGANSELVSSLTGSFYFSILTMATYGDITPITAPARWLVSAHLALSLFLTLGVLARFVSTLPRPQSQDPKEGG